MIDCCLLFQVWWWILDVTVVGLLEDIGCRQNNIKQRNNQATNQPADQPTNQPPSNQCQGSPNPRAKTPLVGWWILDVIVASVSVVCRGWSPPPNSGHMSDTSNISNIVHCLLFFQPRAKDQGPRTKEPMLKWPGGMCGAPELIYMYACIRCPHNMHT